MLSYEGIFFEGESIDLIHQLEGKNKLEIINDEIHCTFKYHPNSDQIFNDLVGTEIEVLIIGYANDGKNSGFSLLLPDFILPYYINYDEENPQMLKIPHITASLKKGAKSKDTKNLKFIPLAEKHKIKGKFGYWIKDGENEYISYDKYDIL